MMKKWIACKIATLKKWKKAKSRALWLEDEVEKEMPDTLIISKQYLLDLAKQSEEFDDKNKLSDFFCPWPDLDEFVDKIFDCLKQSCPYS